MARMRVFMYCSNSSMYGGWGGVGWGGGMKWTIIRYLQVGAETTKHYCKMLEFSQSVTDD